MNAATETNGNGISVRKQKDTSKFAEECIESIGPHALLGEMLQRMTPVEAHMLVQTAATPYPSTVAQSILRDVINRCKQLHEASS